MTISTINTHKTCGQTMAEIAVNFFIIIVIYIFFFFGKNNEKYEKYLYANDITILYYSILSITERKMRVRNAYTVTRTTTMVFDTGTRALPPLRSLTDRLPNCLSFLFSLSLSLYQLLCTIVLLLLLYTRVHISLYCIIIRRSRT